MKKLVISFLISLILLISFISAQNETNETVEPECPGIAISMWCPDETTLCPMTIDEQGCSVWDCDSCEETPPEPEPEICAAKIEINFDKSNYVVGEQFEMKIGVFDSQGNPIPNYVFYMKMYDGIWHTPGSDRTGADGYLKHAGIVEKLPSGITKAIFNVYTEETEFCGVVEGTTEIEVISKEEPDPRPEPEPRPEVCAAKISLSFDKNIYYVGEEFKAVMEVFDSQGNPIPNYVFYIKVYDFDKGMWHPSFEEDRTDGSGYKIHQDKMSMGEPFRFGKNKLKIYTDVGGCNLVEDITIIEVKRREGPGPVPCGMGSCVPEEEEEEIPDERGFYFCSGCEADEKCYPMGYRKSGEYCTPDNEFVNQREEGECDNNFECKSNVCVSGECIGEGLIKKILNWFKKMFGGEEEEEDVEVDCSKLLIEKNIGDYIYSESRFGEDEHTQAPLVSEDGEHMGTIKCCAALYKDKEDTEHGVLFCAYDSKEDVTNSVKWLIAKERNIVFREFRDEKVFGDDKGQVVAWINNAYLIAVGVGPSERNVPLPEDIAEAYLKKYHSEFELTEDDIPDAPPERPWVYCTEEDEKKGDKCESQAGARLQTDPHPDKEKNCEVYKGCILPGEKCESIDDIKEREDCYVRVAEMTGDSSVCEKITSDESRKNKCYVKAAETSKDSRICEKITEEDIKRMCYELVEVFPWESCKSEKDMLKEECHFLDDFESGLGNWVFSDAEGKPNTAWWNTIVENGNTVFKGIGHNWAVLERKEWDNYIFKTRFKIIERSIHFNYRRGEGPFSRYFIGVESDGVSLKKQINKNFYKFDEKSIKLDQGWHTIEIRGYGNILNIYIDDKLLIKYKDTENPLLSGGVAFETLGGSEFLIDDVEVKLITEKDIVYP